MIEVLARFALSLGVTLAWLAGVGAVLALILYVVLVMLPAARSRRARRRNHWRDGMTVEALQRLHRVLGEEEDQGHE